MGTWPLSCDFGHVYLKTIDKTLIKAYQEGVREFDVAHNNYKGFMKYAVSKIFKMPIQICCIIQKWEPSHLGMTFEIADMERSLEESLKRLKRDTINTLYLHNPRGEIINYDPVLHSF